MNEDFLKDFPELEGLYKRYIADPTGHVFAPFADACRKAGLFERAIEVCEQGLENNPRYPSGYVVQGKCLYDMGELERAEEAFVEVLALDENNLVALKYLGLIMADRGDAVAARDKFKHILALDPDNKEIRHKLQELPDCEPEEEIIELRAVRDEDFEGGAISLGAEASTSDELATMTLADIYASQGYADKALRIYREVLSRQPGNDDIKARIRKLEEGEETFPDPSANQRASAWSTIADAAEEPEPKADSARAEEAAPPEREEVAVDTGSGKPGNLDSKSYDHFKRWLKNMSD